MPLDKKIDIANKIRELGNTAFKSGEYELAATKYTKSLRYIYDDTPSGSETKLMQDNKIPILNNRAVCYNKLKKYNLAVNDCTEVLSYDTNNSKALVRLGQAYIGLNDDEMAYKYLQTADSILKHNDKGLLQLIRETKQRIRQHQLNQSKKYSKMFG